MSSSADPTGAALRILDDAWSEVSRSPYVQMRLGRLPSRLPEISLAEAGRRAAVGTDLTQRIAALGDLADPRLPHDLQIALRLARYYAGHWRREADWYWLVHDPLGLGFFGLFSATAYSGGFLVGFLRGIGASAPLEQPGDLDRYLALMADHARLLGQMRERALGQAERGILMPRAQVQQARALVPGLKAAVRPSWQVAAARVRAGDAAAFVAEVERRIASRIEPACDALLAVYDDDYLARAPDAVGMSQYPGGAEVYAELVKLHTTQDLTPQQVHDAGLKRMAEVEAQMQAIRDEVGFRGSAAEYHAQLDADPRWRAGSIEGVTAVFQRYIDRFRPHYERCFDWQTASQPQAEALPAALEGSMTFGYYDGPKKPGDPGRYLFNGANLTRAGLANIGALSYHELVPGHHQHLCTQNENRTQHPLLQHAFVNAYNEGWAEYASTLAGELGCYPEPEERYGRLLMDAFLTCRLVVDTGMNAFGWTLDQARGYLRAKSQMGDNEIRTETIRYSCDIPGQSLAYKLGDTFMFALRSRMQAARGERFSLREFHRAVLHPGALPLPDLAFHLDHVIATEPAAA